MFVCFKLWMSALACVCVCVCVVETKAFRVFFVCVCVSVICLCSWVLIYQSIAEQVLMRINEMNMICLCHITTGLVLKVRTIIDLWGWYRFMFERLDLPEITASHQHVLWYWFIYSGVNFCQQWLFKSSLRCQISSFLCIVFSQPHRVCSLILAQQHQNWGA